MELHRTGEDRSRQQSPRAHGQKSWPLIAVVALSACSSVGHRTSDSSWQIHDTADKPTLCRDLEAADEVSFVESCAAIMASQPSFKNQQAFGIMNVHYAYARGAMGKDIWLGSNERGEESFAGTGYFRNAKAIWIGPSDPITRRDRRVEEREINGSTYFADVTTLQRDGRLHTDSHLHLVLQLSLGAPAGTGNDAAQGVAPMANYVAGIDVANLNLLAARLQQLGLLAIDVGAVPTNYAVDGDGNHFVDSDGNRYLQLYSYQFGTTVPIRRDVVPKFRTIGRSWAQLGVPEADRILFVVPAGNEGRSRLYPRHNAPDYYKNPFVYATMPSLFEYPDAEEADAVIATELKKVVMTAVALGSRTSLATYSNWCGVAREYCFAMPVHALLTRPAWSATQGSTPDSSGTSLAAPLLMGAVALVASRFPAIGNVEAANRLKATASLVGLSRSTKPHQLFGLGIPDLKAATEPLGEMSMVFESHTFALAQSGIRLRASAFGDALHIGLKEHDIMALDQLRTPFHYSATAFVQTGSDSSLTDRHLYLQHRERLKQWTLHIRQSQGSRRMMSVHAGDWRIYLGDGPSPALLNDLTEVLYGHSGVHPGSALAAPWAADALHWETAASSWQAVDDAGFGLRIGWMHFKGRQSALQNEYGIGRATPGEQSGQSLSWSMRFGHRTGLGMQLVDSLNRNELLGLSLEGGFGQWIGGRVQAFGFWGAHWIRHDAAALFSFWQASGEADFGAGALTQVRELSAAAWALALLLQGRGAASGSWLLRLEQPLRMRDGWLQFQLPDKRTRYGDVLHRSLWLSAIPSGRELRLQLDYDHPISHRGGILCASLGRAVEPSHQSGIGSRYYASFGLMLPL